jgi:hypothetical protein
MRAIVAITASVALLMAQVPLVPAHAEAAPLVQSVSQNSDFTETFKAFPDGGGALSKRLTDLILANPKIAPELVVYVRNTPDLNRAQKLAAEQALGAAMDRLRVKAADRPVITKDTVPVAEPDLWWIPVLALALAGGACAYFCNPHHDTPPPFIPPTVH